MQMLVGLRFTSDSRIREALANSPSCGWCITCWGGGVSMRKEGTDGMWRLGTRYQAELKLPVLSVLIPLEKYERTL